MAATRTDSIDLGDAPPGGGQGLAMRGQIAAALFGDVAQPVRIARFEVIEEIGAGGMGVVYRARDPKLDRDVAIKVVQTEEVSARGRERLVREAQTLARLNHPHVVTVYEVGEHEAQVFVAMEFVAGVNLRDWMRAESRSATEVLRLFVDAGLGLAAAHDAGIVHRDFKPANVLMGVDGRVRVADFGLARGDGSRDSTADPTGPAEIGSGRLTHTGAVIGTPAYMAPEQWAKQGVTPATDQFSFCMSLWEGLAGVPPFEHAQVRRAAKEGAALGAPRGADRVPGRLRKALLRGLRIEPGERWPSVDALVSTLAPRRATSWRGFAVVAVGAGVVGAVAASSTDPADDQARVPPCAALRSRLDEAWSPRAQARLRAAHEASTGFAEASWTEIERGVDRHVRAFADAASVVCESGPVEPGPLACLERSAAQLSAYLQRIGDADARVVAQLPIAVSTLESPARCAAPGLAAIQPTPAQDSALHGDVVRARRLIDEATLLLRLGEHRQAETLSAEALELSRATEFLPVVAETQLVRGELGLERGEAHGAREAFLEALDLAQRARHDEAVLLALVGFLRAEAFNDPEPGSMEQWVGLADATLQRLGGRPELQTKLDEAKLELFRLTERFEVALPMARDLAKRGDERSSAAGRRWARRQEANILAQTGAKDGAEAIYRELLDDVERRLGASHPELASLHTALGLLHQDEPETAGAHFQAALDVLEASVGSDNVSYARAALGLAISKAGLGDLEASEALAKEAAEIQARWLPKGNTERSGALILLDQLAFAQKDYRTSLERMKAVLDVLDPERDAENYRMAINDMAYRHRLLGELDQAEPYYRRLRGLVEPDSTLHRYATVGLAAHKLRHGFDDDARALLVGEERPSLDGKPSALALEVWPLWAILDGEGRRSWARWTDLCRERDLNWLIEETETTRRERNDG